MFPGNFVQSTPDKPAVIRPATGESITYRELDERSTQLARYFRSVGAKPGDTSLSSRTTISGRRGVLGSVEIRPLHHRGELASHGFGGCLHRRRLRGDNSGGVGAGVRSSSVGREADSTRAAPIGVRRRLEGFDDYEEAVDAQSTAPLDSQPRGADMLYSSGTTGRPKGIKGDLPEGEVNTTMDPYTAVFAPMYGFDSDTVYLCPAPVYHAAPLRFCGVINSVGGTVILMDAFEAETALELIGKYAVTHSQWVPTMFVRMLKLPKETRDRYDVSTVKVAIHAAAPCPPEVKTAMIDWWGPVIYEYYASTEGSGATFINSEQALSHPGSVGRDGVMGIVHICDDAGRDLPVGEIGTVFWERETLPFRYHNDPEKTAAAQHPDHPTWTTSGDIGYIDSERFLYLTDRAAFTIISGGVNIYPQESENILTLHPKVFDVAVIGVPDEEMGEQVKAVVQLAEGIEPGAHVAEELLEYVRSQVAHFKAPRSIDFADELPRTATGKLVKHKLRSQYVSN